MTRHLFVLIIAIVFFALIFVFKQHKEKILIGGVLVLSLINGVYSITHAESILPSRNATTQTLYHTDYIKSEEFPDAFLRLFLKGKTVYVKNDRIFLEEAEAKGYEWTYAYYHTVSMMGFLSSIDLNLVEAPEMNEKLVPATKMGEFEKLGYLNDLLRNSVMYSPYTDETGSYFYYMWYYNEISDTAYIYANPESLDEEELVLIWQPRSEDDITTEDMYLMGKQYYEENIK